VYKENKMSESNNELENNDESENKIVDSEEFKRMKHLAGLEEADWDDDDDFDDDEMEDFNAPQYIELYSLIAKISMSAVKDIKRWDAGNDFDETRTWDLAERNMKPILKAIEEVYDIGTVLED
jgi:hypothetical protein